MRVERDEHRVLVQVIFILLVWQEAETKRAYIVTYKCDSNFNAHVSYIKLS